MRLRVLGSSGIHPLADNPASGFLVETEAVRLWLDAGTGTFAAFQETEQLAKLDALVISHSHGDHCLDVIPLHYAMRFHADGPLKVPFHAPKDVWTRLGAFLAGTENEAQNGGPDKLHRSFDFQAAKSGGEVEIGDLRVSFHKTEHQVPTLAVRIQHEDRVLVYTADTGPGADLAPFAKGADLLLAEATYAGERIGPPVHLSAAQAGELAHRAEVRQLVLTHLAPDVDPTQAKEEAWKEAGEISVSLARPGRVIQLA